MKCDLLLFSRSLVKDYRWILKPSYLSSADEAVLRAIYSSFDSIKENPVFRSGDLPLLCCLELRSAFVFFTCGTSQFCDSSSRAIYHLQGVAFEKSRNQDFKHAVPLIMANPLPALDAWSVFEINDPDGFLKLDRISNEHRERVLKLEELSDKLKQIGKKLTNINPNYLSQHIAFTRAGYESLLAFIACNKDKPVVEFMFGISVDFANRHDLRGLYVAFIDKQPPENPPVIVQASNINVEAKKLAPKILCFIELISTADNQGCFVARVPSQSGELITWSSEYFDVANIKSSSLALSNWCQLIFRLSKDGWRQYATADEWWTWIMIHD